MDNDQLGTTGMYEWINKYDTSQSFTSKYILTYFEGILWEHLAAFPWPLKDADNLHLPVEFNSKL